LQLWQFWPPKAKNKITRGTSLRVPCLRRQSQNWPWGPKLPQVQNLGGGFVVFFLGGQNRNFGKVRGLKRLLSLMRMSEIHDDMLDSIWKLGLGRASFS